MMCKKIGLSIIAISMVISSVCGQTKRDFVIDLDSLRLASIEYDTYVNELKGEEYQANREAAIALYNKQIYKISKGPRRDAYKNFIISSIEKDSVFLINYKRQNYTYLSAGYFPSSRLLPNALDFYRVVYQSLFVKKEDKLLPPSEFDFLKKKTGKREIYIQRGTPIKNT